MADKQKILIVAKQPAETDGLQEILAPHFDLAVAEDLQSAVRIVGGDTFQAVLTEYLLPALAPEEIQADLENAASTAAREKKALFERLHAAVEAVEKEFGGQKTQTDRLVQRAQNQFEEIKQSMQSNIERFEEKTAKLRSQNLRLTQALERKEKTLQELQGEMTVSTERLGVARKAAREAESAALTNREKAGLAQEKLAAAQSQMAATELKLAQLQQEVKQRERQTAEAIELAEKRFEEKNQLEARLLKLQQNWEDYLGGQ